MFSEDCAKALVNCAGSAISAAQNQVNDPLSNDGVHVTKEFTKSDKLNEG